MAKKFSGILLISDLDGTLLNSRQEVPLRNQKALSRFVSEGGRFTVATGRTVKTAEEFLRKVPVNVPGVLLNGSILYDFASQKILWQAFLSPGIKELCREILKRFPKVTVEFMCGNTIYVLPDKETSKWRSVADDYFTSADSMADVPDEIHKVVFAAKPEYMQELKAFIHSQPLDGIETMHSCDHLYELLPKGANKGSGLLKIAEIYSIPVDHIYAIGDYDNDADMLRVAGFSAVPLLSSEMAHQYADIRLGSCENGAVADFIEYIDKSISLYAEGKL